VSSIVGQAAPEGSKMAVLLKGSRGWRAHSLVIGLLVILVLLNGFADPGLVDMFQAGLLLQTALPLVFVAFAQTLAVLTRGMDLSVGASMAMVSVLTATWMGGFDGGSSWHLLPILGIALGIGLLNGVLICILRLPPIIATLATWSVFNGVAIGLLEQDGGEVPTWLTNLVTGESFGIPNSYFILAVALIIWYQLSRGRLGRSIFAVGGDPERAALNGINVKRTLIATYGLCGLIAGIGGLMLAGATSTGQPTAGDAYILPSVTAVVIGGTSLMGGRGGVGLTILGVLILTLVNSLVQALSLEAWVGVLLTSVLLVAVVVVRAIPDLIKGRA